MNQHLFLIQYIITFTNIFALFPLYAFCITGNYYGAILMACMLKFSLMKHLTEMKNGLPGIGYTMPPTVTGCSLRDDFEKIALERFAKENAKYWLILYQIVATITFIFSFNLFYDKPNKMLFDIVFPVIGFVFLIAGELTNKLVTYAICRCIWHFIAYMSIYYLIV